MRTTTTRIESIRTIDSRIEETYTARLKGYAAKQADRPLRSRNQVGVGPYWDEGIVALVTNNSFLDQIAFDGMRKIARGGL